MKYSISSNLSLPNSGLHGKAPANYWYPQPNCPQFECGHCLLCALLHLYFTHLLIRRSIHTFNHQINYNNTKICLLESLVFSYSLIYLCSVNWFPYQLECYVNHMLQHLFALSPLFRVVRNVTYNHPFILFKPKTPICTTTGHHPQAMSMPLPTTILIQINELIFS